ncbi:MAG: NADPH-dependent F420 reductase [marine benthic group bacterium]|jgi:predicted dinucleotide-binding enzyme|nr:NADPH-dependent F420 reductase [Gemmatimonadota bacterium]MCL7962603.1 NADPH-dependent F420 reductase [Candidatus Carthagonibacter metallireducens]MCL7957470.1 NADPH-dependent F420 reductase [Gemmatimonadota bacterium]MCL7967128.1 NADPH-dependent F420 reductase [Gemmatimonadota bacterium]MCL7968216.1 NADPH-dependent F420 reductase [Gemmatimonadota bacterium]
MRIGVVGTGSVGRVLGSRLAEIGHQVVFGSRTPSAGRVEGIVTATGHGVSAGLPREAAAESEVVILATPWHGTETAVRGLGELGSRVLVDCTNPLLTDLSGLDHTGGRSGGEQVAEWAAGGRIVKAFNTTGAANLADPAYGEQRLVMPLCGDDSDANAIVADLARELGFEPVACGGIGAASLLENLAMLWITLAHGQGLGPQVGFALLRRER